MVLINDYQSMCQVEHICMLDLPTVLSIKKESGDLLSQSPVGFIKSLKIIGYLDNRS